MILAHINGDLGSIFRRDRVIFSVQYGSGVDLVSDNVYWIMFTIDLKEKMARRELGST